MAKALSLSLAAYHLYEKGEREPNLTNLQKIADILHVTIDDLFKSSIREKANLDEVDVDRQIFDAMEPWDCAGYKVEIKEEWGGILIRPPEGEEEELFPLEMGTLNFLKLTERMMRLVDWQASDKRFATLAYVVLNKKAALKRENPFNLIGDMVPLQYLPTTKKATE